MMYIVKGSSKAIVAALIIATIVLNIMATIKTQTLHYSEYDTTLSKATRVLTILAPGLTGLLLLGILR